jgi:phosphoglycolate phosphatase-like HAD superfamily hydrolase
LSPNKFIVFDLDGTLCDHHWRLTLLPEVGADGGKSDADYADYNSQHEQDAAINMLNFAQARACHPDALVVFLTARPQRYERTTLRWLREKAGVTAPTGARPIGQRPRRQNWDGQDATDCVVIMRPDGDCRPSTELKPALLKAHGIALEDVVLVCEDRLDVLHALLAGGAKVGALYRRNEPPYYFDSAAQVSQFYFAIQEIETHHPGQGKFFGVEKKKGSAGEPRTADQILIAMGETFKERNAQYGSNYKMVAPLVKILFPDGVPREVIESDAWHLFELKLVKLSRFAISNFQHKDSIHDDAVHSAMIESILEGQGL